MKKIKHLFIYNHDIVNRASFHDLNCFLSLVVYAN